MSQKKLCFFLYLIVFFSITSQAQLLNKAKEKLSKATNTSPSPSPASVAESSQTSLGNIPGTGAVGYQAKIVFAKSELPGFESASAAPISEVKDGDPLWMYVKLDKPIREMVQVDNFTDDDGNIISNQFFIVEIAQNDPSNNAYNPPFAKQTIFIKGGDKTPTGMEYNKGIVGYLDIDPGATEFKLRLDGYSRRKSSYVFLEAVGGGSAGKWNNEIRLVGKEWKVFAKAPLLCNVENGIPQYRKMWNAYKTIKDKGDIADNNLPPAGQFNDAKVKAAIAAEAKTKGITASKIVFTTDEWRVLTDEYNRKSRKVNAYLMYKKGAHCVYAMAEVEQKLVLGNWASSIVSLYNMDTPVDCNKAK